MAVVCTDLTGLQQVAAETPTTDASAVEDYRGAWSTWFAGVASQASLAVINAQQLEPPAVDAGEALDQAWWAFVNGVHDAAVQASLDLIHADDPDGLALAVQQGTSSISAQSDDSGLALEDHPQLQPAFSSLDECAPLRS
jgi:hypothetical protein